MDSADLTHRFTYHAPSDVDIEKHQAIRDQCLALALLLNDIVPEGREKSLAMTNLEQVASWANAGVARAD